MDAETVEVEGITIVLWIVAITILGFIGYAVGWIEAPSVLTGEDVFRAATNTPSEFTSSTGIEP